MKTFLAFIFLCGSLQGATLNQVRTRVDDWLAGKWSAITNKQQQFFDANGKYWQGLITHTNEPAHTTTTTNDTVSTRLTLHPTDQQETWLDNWPSLAAEQFPAALRIDVYSGPLGLGYVATVFVRYNGVTYTRSQNRGPENWHTKAWSIYAPTQLP